MFCLKLYQLVLRFWNRCLLKVRGSSLRNVRLGYDSKIESGGTLSNVQIGNHSFCGYNCEISDSIIGSFCSIGNDVILNPGIHPIDWVSTSPVFYTGRDSVKTKYSHHDKPLRKTLIIGNDVWIGSKSIIMGGVKVGNGAIVAASAVVTKDVPPYAIVGGIPARLISYRFEESMRQELEKICWWDLSTSELRSLSNSFNDPREFLARLKKI